MRPFIDDTFSWSKLETRPGFVAVKLGWASGLMVLVRTNSLE